MCAKPVCWNGWGGIRKVRGGGIFGGGRLWAPSVEAVAERCNRGRRMMRVRLVRVRASGAGWHTTPVLSLSVQGPKSAAARSSICHYFMAGDTDGMSVGRCAFARLNRYALTTLINDPRNRPPPVARLRPPIINHRPEIPSSLTCECSPRPSSWPSELACYRQQPRCYCHCGRRKLGCIRGASSFFGSGDERASRLWMRFSNKSVITYCQHWVVYSGSPSVTADPVGGATSESSLCLLSDGGS